MTEQQRDMTEEQQQKWVREKYQAATKYLATQGLVTDSVVVEESRYLVPLLAVWKLKVIDGSYVWVISGDLPTDHNVIDVATNAREAVRHFSFKWQMQAENLLKTDDKEQQEFAKLLIGRAEGLYDMYQNNSIWQM